MFFDKNSESSWMNKETGAISTPPLKHEGQEIERTKSGSIDIEYYTQQVHEERSKIFVNFFKSVFRKR